MFFFTNDMVSVNSRMGDAHAVMGGGSNGKLVGRFV